MSIVNPGAYSQNTCMRTAEIREPMIEINESMIEIIESMIGLGLGSGLGLGVRVRVCARFCNPLFQSFFFAVGCQNCRDG